MRALAILLACLTFGSAEAEPVRFPQAWSGDLDKLIAQLQRDPPHLSVARLPAGTRIGKCLLIVDGMTRISGPCSYSIAKGGDFHIDGPRQVFDGIDYPKAGGMAEMISTDWWADVFWMDGEWTGYANDTLGSVHGQESRWGKLIRKGACYENRGIPGDHQQVRVCLWRK